MAAFFLIRYKLKVATNEEQQAEDQVHQKEMVDSPTSITSSDLEFGQQNATRNQLKGRHQPINDHNTDPIPGLIRVKVNSPAASAPPIYSTNPHLVQVGPFKGQPPTHLLARCHTLCIFLTALGFVLALMGIMCFAWDRLPLSVSVSSSFFMAMCTAAVAFILMKPYPEEGTLSGQIYYQDKGS